MKVLHVFSRLDKGGAESRVIEMQRTLYDKGVVFDYLFRSSGEHFYTGEAQSMGSSFYVIKQPTALTMIPYIFKVRKLVKGNYDIVQSHMSVFSGFVLLGAKLAGAKVRIAHSRSGPLQSEIDKFSFKRKLLLRFYRFLINKTATHMVSCSTDAANYLFGPEAVKNGKVYYIRNAIDFNRFNVDTEVPALKQKFGVKEGKTVFVNVGNLLPVKNHVFLVNIFNEYCKKNPDSVLLIAGEGSERPLIEAEIKRLGLDNVTLLGRCDCVPELLKIADYFVMTSKYEGVPGAAIEAMASGVPCYLSDRITRDIDFGESMTRYFSLDSTAEEIASFIAETKDSMEHSKQRFQSVLSDNKYEIGTACEEMLKIYEDRV